MDDVEQAVLRGRTPPWRELWEERLSSEARRRINRAVRRGEAVADPFEAALAAGRARQHRLAAWFLLLAGLPLQMGLAAFWLHATCFAGERHDVLCPMWAVLAGLLLVVGPLVALPRVSRARLAEERNRRRYEDALRRGSPSSR